MCVFEEKMMFLFFPYEKCPLTSNWTWELSHTLSDGFTS